MGAHKKQCIFSILAILTIAVILTCIFAACNKIGAQDSSFRVTIHPNNGQSDIVWDINTDIPSITKDGYHVAGYYLDAKMTISTSLESLKATGLTKNVDVYVKWEKDLCNHVEAIDNPVEPTCTETGLTQGKHCSVCGEILQAQSVVPALGHTEVIDDAIAATCTENGKTEGKHCSVCNEVIVAQTVVPALGHDFEHHNKHDATCTEMGWDEYDTCKRVGCGYTTYQEIPALGHKYSQDWSNDKTYHWHASTCGHDVVSDKEKHSFDSNWVCTECTYADTGLHGVELRTNTLELDGTDIFGKVSNSTSTFSFINEIAIADSATYIVSTDINGSNVIRTKTVSLSIGDNTFYILVENGKDLGLYTVVIRRRPMYSVSFNVNGGTSVSSQTIEEDCFATEPTTERKGYAFDKWDYDFSEPIIKDTTITASWNIVTYNVYYDLNVPSDSISKDVDNSMNVATYTVEDAITFKTPTRKGYRFTGWDKNIEKGTVGDVTVTASWEAIEYDIVYDFGDADSVSKATNNAQNPSKYTIEDAITFAEPSREGYMFIAWDKNIVRGTIDAQTITASWEVINYSITYDFSIAESSKSRVVDNSKNTVFSYTIEDAVSFNAPTRVGYTFASWDVPTIEKGTYGNKTIVASWNIIDYSITYNLNGGTNHSENPLSFNIEQLPITLKDADSEDNAFNSWRSINSLDGDKITQITTIGDKTVYAIFGGTEGLQYSLGSDGTYYTVSGYTGTLTDVVIDKRYNDKPITEISRGAFENNTNIVSIKLPNTITSIDGYAFV